MRSRWASQHSVAAPHPRITLWHTDARLVPEDGPFDLIVAGPLHDMSKPAEVLDAARTALAEGGVIAVARRHTGPNSSATRFRSSGWAT